jgi:ring-1,2-phenylacetyl-CoA epoxidase subunit PaaE
VVIVRDGLQREIASRASSPASSMRFRERPRSAVLLHLRRLRHLPRQAGRRQVRMERNFALDKKEVAAGFVLTCQAHPITERVVLSFDER